jgi:hypothetical protein
MNIDNLLGQLRSELTRIEHAIAALETLAGGARPQRGRPPKAERARHMSAAARKRISEAMKQRWAKWKGKSAPKAKAASPKKAARRPMSPAARKKLSAMMKARWEQRRKAQA